MASRIGTQVGFVAGAAVSLARAVVQRGAPDVLVIVSEPGWGGSLTAWLPRDAAGRVVHWVMDLYPEALRAQWPASPVIQALEKPMRAAIDAAWRRADAIVTLTGRMAAKIGSRVPQAKVRVIPLWAPDGVRPMDDRGLVTRRARGIPDDAFVVLYHGSLGIAYDLVPIVESAEQLATKRETVIAFVGDGAQRSWLERQVSERRLANVRVFDRVSQADLGGSLATGDVHLVSVRPGWDGVAFPSKIVGGLAAGRPVILLGPKDCEIADMLHADASGEVAANGDELSSLLRSLRADPARRARMGVAARAAYERRFSREHALLGWDEVMFGA